MCIVCRMYVVLVQRQISMCLRLFRPTVRASDTVRKDDIILLSIISFSSVAVFLLRIMEVMGSELSTFMILFSSSRRMAGQYLSMGHDRFRPHLFLIHYYALPLSNA